MPTELIGWVAQHILPHERALRRWLRSAFPRHDVDDVVQETYCRLAGIDDVTAIAEPKRYLFQTARNVVLADLRRQRVVRIEAIGGIAEMERALIADADEPGPERILAGRALLGRVEALLATLPERSRTIFRLRKFDGLSQRAIAQRLGVTETIVENDVARGLKAIIAGMTDGERADLPLRSKRLARGAARHRRGD